MKILIVLIILSLGNRPPVITACSEPVQVIWTDFDVQWVGFYRNWPDKPKGCLFIQQRINEQGKLETNRIWKELK